jgi:aspartyl-tRNA(Asn)/glutamyl-tRNA(Gln) amidotransferase subunit A
MARSVEDCALLLQIIAGYDKSDPASASVAVPDFRGSLKNGIGSLRIGVPRADWFHENKGVDLQTEAVFNDALKILKSLGAHIVDIGGQAFSLARKANQTILIAEAYAYHEKRLQEAPKKFGSSVRRRLLEGAFLSAADYITALRARAVLNEQIASFFAQVDCFATPTQARPPDAFEGYDPNEQNQRPNFTNPFNLTGLPAISVPCGFTPDNLPIGLQIIAPPFEEATCFRVAYAYEQATSWHERRPPID